MSTETPTVREGEGGGASLTASSRQSEFFCCGLSDFFSAKSKKQKSSETRTFSLEYRDEEESKSSALRDITWGLV